MSHIPSVNNPHVPVLTGDKKNMDFWYFTPRYLTKVEINFRKSNNDCKFLGLHETGKILVKFLYLTAFN